MSLASASSMPMVKTRPCIAVTSGLVRPGPVISSGSMPPVGQSGPPAWMPGITLARSSPAVKSLPAAKRTAQRSASSAS